MVAMDDQSKNSEVNGEFESLSSEQLRRTARFQLRCSGQRTLMSVGPRNISIHRAQNRQILRRTISLFLGTVLVNEDNRKTGGIRKYIE